MAAVADIVAAFRNVAPEYDAMDDTEVETAVDFCSDFVSEARFGPYYAKAVACYSAHLLKMQGMADEEGAESGTLTAGDVIMEREGDLQRQYGAAAGSSSAAGQYLSKTIYGRMFLHLRALCIVPAMTRMG